MGCALWGKRYMKFHFIRFSKLLMGDIFWADSPIQEYLATKRKLRGAVRIIGW